MVNRCNNRIILDVADFGIVFPTAQELNDFSIEPWRQLVEEAKDNPTEYFEKGVFVDIHLPIRMNGNGYSSYAPHLRKKIIFWCSTSGGGSTLML